MPLAMCAGWPEAFLGRDGLYHQLHGSANTVCCRQQHASIVWTKMKQKSEKFLEMSDRPT